ncbi:MAG TPA: glutamine-hydrolyzing carbamoyl-phosphate synthase small subunit [Firmicutes bacterium]|nr:glutamine-hydrolyzing carbamoyl-phosphate synthase small subunit [Bacillota bacterium]
MRALLALEDGFVLEGRAFAGSGEVYGEVVFNTSMTGYQEILTDPSYKGQIVTLTYPLIGNYGTNPEDMEAPAIRAEALIVREYSPYPHNFRCRATLADFIEFSGALGVEGIDTRALTKHIRELGAMKGVLSTIDLDPGSLVEKARNSPGLVGRDLVKYVTSDRMYIWDEGGESEFTVVAMDFGVKLNILRMLKSAGCRVIVVPAGTTASEVLSLNPDGIFLSNGPGDPAALSGIVEEVRKLLGKKPIFGICLGHQILGRALGLDTFKLKFGHRGGNQPVKDLKTGRVEITAQNHGFCVEIPDGGGPGDLEVTHINLNDGTLEGMESRELRFFSVQYHPEASPGPHDSRYLFERFASLMRGEVADCA